MSDKGHDKTLFCHAAPINIEHAQKPDHLPRHKALEHLRGQHVPREAAALLYFKVPARRPHEHDHRHPLLHGPRGVQRRGVLLRGGPALPGGHSI